MVMGRVLYYYGRYPGLTMKEDGLDCRACMYRVLYVKWLEIMEDGCICHGLVAVSMGILEHEIIHFK